MGLTLQTVVLVETCRFLTDVHEKPSYNLCEIRWTLWCLTVLDKVPVTVCTRPASRSCGSGPVCGYRGALGLGCWKEGPYHSNFYSCSLCFLLWRHCEEQCQHLYHETEPNWTFCKLHLIIFCHSNEEKEYGASLGRLCSILLHPFPVSGSCNPQVTLPCPYSTAVSQAHAGTSRLLAQSVQASLSSALSGRVKFFQPNWILIFPFSAYKDYIAHASGV